MVVQDEYAAHMGKLAIPHPTINIIINYLSLLGKYWVGSLKISPFLMGDFIHILQGSFPL
jgi:hypothetical protein